MVLFARLLKEESGFVVSAELVLVATIVVLGLITGLATVRDQVITELADVADAISEVDQSYSYSGVSAHSSSTAGSVFDDNPDFCEAGGPGADQLGNAGTQCLVVGTPATGE